MVEAPAIEEVGVLEAKQFQLRLRAIRMPPERGLTARGNTGSDWEPKDAKEDAREDVLLRESDGNLLPHWSDARRERCSPPRCLDIDDSDSGSKRNIRRDSRRARLDRLPRCERPLVGSQNPVRRAAALAAKTILTGLARETNRTLGHRRREGVLDLRRELGRGSAEGVRSVGGTFWRWRGCAAEGEDAVVEKTSEVGP